MQRIYLLPTIVTLGTLFFNLIKAAGVRKSHVLTVLLITLLMITFGPAKATDVAVQRACEAAFSYNPIIPPLLLLGGGSCIIEALRTPGNYMRGLRYFSVGAVMMGYAAAGVILQQEYWNKCLGRRV